MNVDKGKVSAHWTFEPLEKGGTRAEVHVCEGVASVVLGIDLHGTTPPERRLLLKNPIQVRSIVLCGTLLVFLVEIGNFAYDMPFCPWINGEVWSEELLSALATLDRFHVVLVREGMLRRIYRVKTDHGTGPSIAAAIRSFTSKLDAETYNIVVDAYQSTCKPQQLLKMSKALDRDHGKEYRA